MFNTLRRRRNEQHFADDIFKRIFFNENVWISLKISLKFVPRGPINNIPALVQIMAWRRSGDKPLSESIMVSLPTHICVTRPQWVNSDITGTFLCQCSVWRWIPTFSPIKVSGLESRTIPQSTSKHMCGTKPRLIWIQMRGINQYISKRWVKLQLLIKQTKINPSSVKWWAELL